MRARFAETFPQAVWHEWEPLSRDEEIAGADLVFDQPVRPHFHFAKADVIVSLDDDFLQDHPDALVHMRDFAQRRRPENHSVNRLYVMESSYTVTGSQADVRHAVPSGAISQAGWSLAAQIFLEERSPRFRAGSTICAARSRRPPDTASITRASRGWRASSWSTAATRSSRSGRGSPPGCTRSPT